MAKLSDIEINELIEIADGQCYIGYAIRGNGKLEAREFLEQLDKRKRAYFLNLFRLKSKGEIFDKKKFEKIKASKKIFEFKRLPSGERIFCFSYPVKFKSKYKGESKNIGIWWLTHGFEKKTPKTPSAQIRRAEQIKKEHIEFLVNIKRR